MVKSLFLRNALFLAAVLFLAACNDGASTSHEEHHHHDEAAMELSLNDGQKWKSDAATDNNVAYLKNTVDAFTADSGHAIDTYQSLGNDLVEGLNKMIRECKMSGPDHDALHVWLEPVIQQSNQLKTSEDIAQADAIFNALKKRIDVYPQYFEEDIK